MNKSGKERTSCSNEGCPRVAEEGSPFCASCSLEWGLFHREERGARSPAEGSPEPDQRP